MKVPSGRRVAGWAILLAAALPAVVAVVTTAGQARTLAQDPASVQLMVRDVFGSQTPLVGAYSRGFNHPGPAFFYALAPLSRLAGGATWALSVGAALIQGAAGAALAWLCLRRAGPWFAAVMVGALGLGYLAFDFGGQFTDAWNPFAAYPWFLVMLVLAWGFATGHRYDIVGLAAAGSFVVQCHVGYLPLVGAVVLWSVAVAVWSRRSSADAGTAVDAPSWRRVAAWAAGVLALMWLPPVVEQLRHGSDGNLALIWRYFRNGGDALGLRAGAGIFAAEFKWWPPWLGGTQATGFGTGSVVPASLWWLLVPAVLLVGGWFAARRSGRRADRLLVELAAVATVASIVALSRVTVTPYHYVFYWRIAVAVFVVAASGWAVAHALPTPARSSRGVRVVAAGALAVVITVTCVASVADVVNGNDGFRHLEPAVEAAMAHVDAAGLPREPVLVRSLGSTIGGFDQGVISALDQAGAPVRVDPQFGFHFGDQRTADPADVAEVWYLSEEGRFGDTLRALPGAREVVGLSPLSRAQERELRQLQAQVTTALSDAGRDDLVESIDSPYFDVVLTRALRDTTVPGLDQATARRVARLNGLVADARSCRCVIVAFPAADAPQLPYSLG